MKLFKYTIYAEFNESKEKKRNDNYTITYPYGSQGFEIKYIESNSIFSSSKNAEDAAKKRIIDEDVDFKIIEINEFYLDQDGYNGDLNIQIINSINKKKYNFSWNQEYDHKKNLYQRGDWVYFVENGRYQIGIISAEAEKDEPYLIISENNSLNDPSTHNHVSEAFIIKRMTKEEVEKILPAKFYTHINTRYHFKY